MIKFTNVMFQVVTSIIIIIIIIIILTRPK